MIVTLLIASFVFMGYQLLWDQLQLLLKNIEPACTTIPCENGGECFDNNTLDYTCVCKIGYIGRNCDEDACGHELCGEYGACAPTETSFICNCQPGATGPYCTKMLCPDKICKNGGTCKLNDDNCSIGADEFDESLECDFTPTLQCECPDDYYGTYCENENNACRGNPCIVDGYYIGVCGVIDNGYTCPCINSLPCYNNGSCSTVNDTYSCTCPTGINGTNCEVTPCSPNPCLNGSCSYNEIGYTCSCSDGYSGDNCEISNCTESTCKNNGTCEINQLHQPECSCQPGYDGSTCDITPCTVTSCLNDGVCHLPVLGGPEYECNCTSGYNGTFCETDLCTPSCMNFGKCEINETLGELECVCLDGYSGTACEESVVMDAVGDLISSVIDNLFGSK